MMTKIQKWGNSLAVRLPKRMMQELGLHAGSKVVVGEQNNAVVVKALSNQDSVTHKDWKQYLISTNRTTKRNVSGRVDEIVYGSVDR